MLELIKHECDTKTLWEKQNLGKFCYFSRQALFVISKWLQTRIFFPWSLSTYHTQNALPVKPDAILKIFQNVYQSINSKQNLQISLILIIDFKVWLTILRKYALVEIVDIKRLEKVSEIWLNKNLQACQIFL